MNHHWGKVGAFACAGMMLFNVEIINAGGISQSRGGAGSYMLPLAPPPQETPEERAAREAYDLAQKQKFFVPRDPWRISVVDSHDGHAVLSTNYAKGMLWAQFSGEVIEVRSEGILVNGYFGKPIEFCRTGSPRIFYVVGFPYPVKPALSFWKGANILLVLALQQRVFKNWITAKFAHARNRQGQPQL